MIAKVIIRANNNTVESVVMAVATLTKTTRTTLAVPCAVELFGSLTDGDVLIDELFDGRLASVLCVERMLLDGASPIMDGVVAVLCLTLAVSVTVIAMTETEQIYRH